MQEKQSNLRGLRRLGDVSVDRTDYEMLLPRVTADDTVMAPDTLLKLINVASNQQNLVPQNNAPVRRSKKISEVHLHMPLRTARD